MNLLFPLVLKAWHSYGAIFATPMKSRNILFLKAQIYKKPINCPGIFYEQIIKFLIMQL
jgi:hypothetical protein